MRIHQDLQSILLIFSHTSPPAGTGVFEIWIEKKRSFADARRADHQAVDIVAVHHGDHLTFLPRAAEDEPLLLRTFFSCAPELCLEGNVLEGPLNFFLCRPARRAVHDVPQHAT